MVRAASVVLWDLSEVLDDTLTCVYMKQVRNHSLHILCRQSQLHCIRCMVGPLGLYHKLYITQHTPVSMLAVQMAADIDPSLACALRLSKLVCHCFAAVPQAIELCGKDSRLRPYCDTSKLLLMGHSRGAKLSCLIAEQVMQ